MSQSRRNPAVTRMMSFLWLQLSKPHDLPVLWLQRRRTSRRLDTRTSIPHQGPVQMIRRPRHSTPPRTRITRRATNQRRAEFQFETPGQSAPIYPRPTCSQVKKNLATLLAEWLVAFLKPGRTSKPRSPITYTKLVLDALSGNGFKAPRIRPVSSRPEFGQARMLVHHR